MFTVRVDHENGGGRDVYGCVRYKVVLEPARALVLFGTEGQPLPAEQVVLVPGDRVYVMNQAGETIDQLTCPRDVARRVG